MQSLSVVPGWPTPVGVRPASASGVEVIDVSGPCPPLLTQAYPVVSLGGVHTSRSNVIPAGGGPRAPGQYLFSVANGFGVGVTRVQRTPPSPPSRP